MCSGQLKARVGCDGVDQAASQGGGALVVGQLEQVEAGGGGGQTLHVLAYQGCQGGAVARDLQSKAQIHAIIYCAIHALLLSL